MDGSGHDFLWAADKAFWLDDLHESLRLGNLAVETFQQQGNVEGLAIALQNRSLFNRELFHVSDYLGRAKAAQRDASISLAVVEEHKLNFLYGLSCFHLAEAEMLLRDYEEAIVYFEQALMAFHHSGVLAQKGHYVFRLGEAQYSVSSPNRKSYAHEMMRKGIAQLHTDVASYPFPFVSLLLIQDTMRFAGILGHEGKKFEAQRYIEEAEKVLSTNPELLIFQRKYETMKEFLILNS